MVDGVHHFYCSFIDARFSLNLSRPLVFLPEALFRYIGYILNYFNIFNSKLSGYRSIIIFEL